LSAVTGAVKVLASKEKEKEKEKEDEEMRDEANRTSFQQTKRLSLAGQQV